MRRAALILSILFAALGCGYDAGDPVDGGGRVDARSVPVGDAQPGGDGDAGLPACGNGVDDDCDGRIDFAGGDPGCASAADADERGAGLVCDDGLDNDGDGLTDHAAPECGGAGDAGCDSPFDTTEIDTPDPF